MSASMSSRVVGAFRAVRIKATSFSIITLGIAGLIIVETALGLMSATVRAGGGSFLGSFGYCTIRGHWAQQEAIELHVLNHSNALVLIPGHTIRMPWNLVTSSFIESSLLGLVLSLAVLFLSASVAEAVYGPTEFAKLIGVAALSSGIVSFVVQYIMFIAARRGAALFTETGGFYGVQGALLVAVKHVLPGQEVMVLPGVAVSTQYLPGIFLIVCTVWSLITVNIGLLRFALVGTYSGWFYLRFIKVAGVEGMRGDPSADFALSTLCPQAVQPALSVAFTAIARACGLHRAPAPALPITQPATSGLAGSRAAGGAGSAEADPLLDRDAARRRELGRQALEARLLAAGMQPAQGSVSASSSPGAQRGASNVGSAAGSPAMGDREQN